MKIICQSCGAKYSVADDKIAGRSVKIRCKKCSDVIAIAAGPAWHAVVDGETRGPFTLPELGELLASATIGWDGYVWQEGMLEWQPAREVAAVVAAVPSRDQRAPSADLFATTESTDDVVASPAPSAAHTGQRNESSVLFSLANLQSLAARPDAAARPGATPPRGNASGDGSGLIDIRALAAVTVAPAKNERVEDLLAIGVGAAPFTSLGTPLLAPAPRERGNRGLAAGIGVATVAILAAAAVVVVVLVRPPRGDAGVARRDRVGDVSALATDRHQAPVTSVTTPPTVGSTGEPAGPALVAAPASAVAVAAPVARPVVRRRAGDSPTRPAARTTVTTAATPTDSATPRESNVDQIIGDLVGHPRATPTLAPASAAPDESLPATPSRDQVRSALGAVQTAVRACGGGQHGLVTTRISVSGATGHVSSADVTGTFAGTPTGSCVARAARNARFPQFRQPSFDVTFPFAI